MLFKKYMAPCYCAFTVLLFFLSLGGMENVKNIKPEKKNKYYLVPSLFALCLRDKIPLEILKRAIQYTDKATKETKIQTILDLIADNQVSAQEGMARLCTIHISPEDQTVFNKTLEILLTLGADPCQMINNTTPLHDLAQQGNVSAVEFLWNYYVADNQKRLDLDCRDSCGNTPLHMAASAGHLDVVRYLVQRDVDINQKNNKNETPIYKAVEHNHYAVVDFLIHKNAYFIVKVNFNTLLHTAAVSGAQECAELLIKHCKELVNTQGTWKQLPIHDAAGFGYVGLVNLLIKNGSKIDVVDEHGHSPLYYAIKYRYLAVTKVLALYIQAYLFEKNFTYLHRACQIGDPKIVETLIQNGQNGHDVNAVDSKGWTPLFHAVKEEHVKVIDLLKKHGAQIDIFDNEGRTPLAIALEYDKIKSMQCLLSSGADPNLMLSNGSRALHYAVRKSNGETLKLFLEEPRLQVNAQDQGGKTALFHAEYKFMIDLLLNKGARVDIVDNQQKTALHWACQKGEWPKVICLLAAGASVHERDKWERTALHYATSLSKYHSDTRNIIKKLLENGADPNVEDDFGWTPFARGLWLDNDTIKLLREHSTLQTQVSGIFVKPSRLNGFVHALQKVGERIPVSYLDLPRLTR